MTTGFEREVSRNALAATRAVMKFPSYRKKGRPKAYPFRFGPENARREIMLPSEDHPGTFSLPLFSEPGRPVAQSKVPGAPVIDFSHVYHKDNLRAVMQAVPMDHVVLSYPEPVAFARFLAKVAYSFCGRMHRSGALTQSPGP